VVRPPRFLLLDQVIPSVEKWLPPSPPRQVTIPKPIRDYLGLKPGDRVRFELTGEQVVISSEQAKDDAAQDVFERLRGHAGKSGMTTDELMQLLRGDD
jgi:antitoxin PrlF